MEGSSKKFRLANLMVNLGTGELLKPGYPKKKCKIFHSMRIPEKCVFNTMQFCTPNSPCGYFSCGAFTQCGVHSPCGGIQSLYEVVPCAAGSLIPDYLDIKYTPIITEEIDDLEVIVELKNDLQVALKAVLIQEEALTSAYQPQTLEEADQLELELKKALKVVEEMKGKLPGRK